MLVNVLKPVWLWVGSNHRPQHYECRTLTAELHSLNSVWVYIDKCKRSIILRILFNIIVFLKNIFSPELCCSTCLKVTKIDGLFGGRKWQICWKKTFWVSAVMKNRLMKFMNKKQLAHFTRVLSTWYKALLSEVDSVVTSLQKSQVALIILTALHLRRPKNGA